MSKCAFVIPLHPKHFDYGYYIFNYLYDKSVDLYFVFTIANEKDNFLSKMSTKISKEVNFLVLTDFTDIGIVEKNSSFVSIKKLFALSKLKDKYAYISCIDSEIQFLEGNNDYYNAMKNLVNSKIICGGKLEPNSGIIKIISDSATILINEKYHENLKSISQDYRIYTWWSNLPVYDCKIAGEFLDWINFSSNNLDRFCWNIFDDIMYNFFCILFYNYELKVIDNCFHSLELSDSNLIEYVDKNICKLYWVNKNAYYQNRKYYEENNFLIVFHLDRWGEINQVLKNTEYYNPQPSNKPSNKPNNFLLLGITIIVTIIFFIILIIMCSKE